MKTELQVPSDIRFLKVVEQWLLDSLQVALGERTDWEKQASRLRLVIVEAYSNVIRHAHHGQCQIPVILCLEGEGRAFSLKIWDRGEGYDIGAYAPPHPSDRQEGGYGWLILNQLMDRVEYEPQPHGGNCLKLYITFPDDPGASPSPSGDHHGDPGVT